MTATDARLPCPLASACAQRPPLSAARLFCKVCPNGRFVDPIGIEVGIIPFDHALMVEMLRVRDRLQKGLIAHWSADIRRGTAALRTDEARIIDAGRRCLDRPVHVV